MRPTHTCRAGCSKRVSCLSQPEFCLPPAQRQTSPRPWTTPSTHCKSPSQSLCSRGVRVLDSYFRWARAARTRQGLILYIFLLFPSGRPGIIRVRVSFLLYLGCTLPMTELGALFPQGSGSWVRNCFLKFCLMLQHQIQMLGTLCRTRKERSACLFGSFCSSSFEQPEQVRLVSVL